MKMLGEGEVGQEFAEDRTGKREGKDTGEGKIRETLVT